MPEIRPAVRTGDTLMPERRAMLKRPPPILVTTPESLYILLTSERSRAVLRDVETVIVDEIHAVADDKRGAHLALSLESLDALPHRRAVRIGLSATQKPIEEVGRFLTGDRTSAAKATDLGGQLFRSAENAAPPNRVEPSGAASVELSRTAGPVAPREGALRGQDGGATAGADAGAT